MARQAPLIIGIKGHVLAIDRATGTELWRTRLKGGEFVSVSVQDSIYASTKGELFCVDPATGSIKWHNRLSGMGVGLVSIGGDVTTEAEALQRAAAAAAAASAS